LTQALPRNLSRTVAGNTLLLGAEMVFAILAAFLTTVPLARVMGPARLSYFTYLQWLTNIGGLFAMVGIPATTRKYMAEYLGVGRLDLVWAVYRSGLWMQTLFAAVLLISGTFVALIWVPSSYHWIAFLLLLNVALKLVACIPSNAHQAAENMRPNLIGAMGGGVVSILGVNLSLWYGPNLTWVAASFVAGIAVETAIKMYATRGRLVRVPGAVLPTELKQRMLRFSGQGMALMVLNLVVWDRSDLVFLKMLDHDPRQVTFFSLVFNLVDKILLLPQTLSRAIETSLMAEYGRNREKFYQAVSLSLKYALLASAPLMLGLAALSGPLMRLVYGPQYAPAIAVLLIAASLAVAKPLLVTAQGAMQAQEQQTFLIGWSIACAILNVTLDLTLIPFLGARGAMLANGLAQAVAVIGIWYRLAYRYPVLISTFLVLRILLCGAAVFATVRGLGVVIHSPVVHVLVGVPTGALIYLLALRCLAVLDHSDGSRILSLASRFPARPQRAIAAILRMTVKPRPECQDAVGT